VGSVFFNAVDSSLLVLFSIKTFMSLLSFLKKENEAYEITILSLFPSCVPQ
jgi:hypothetical protein